MERPWLHRAFQTIGLSALAAFALATQPNAVRSQESGGACGVCLPIEYCPSKVIQDSACESECGFGSTSNNDCRVLGDNCNPSSEAGWTCN